ncbi:MAG: hypothetical protein HUU26_13165, partial [Gemmatimonadaceae bacterium]|nr:hypothetical protein [Gemmatimonadaceae bacterium]
MGGLLSPAVTKIIVGAVASGAAAELVKPALAGVTRAASAIRDLFSGPNVGG